MIDELRRWEHGPAMIEGERGPQVVDERRQRDQQATVMATMKRVAIGRAEVGVPAS
jgi:hypothetical protein